MAIAGFTDSTTVIAALTGEPGKPARAAVMRTCLGRFWWEQDAATVFGETPVAAPFALMSIGEPALPGPGEYYDCVED